VNLYTIGVSGTMLRLVLWQIYLIDVESLTEKWGLKDVSLAQDLPIGELLLVAILSELTQEAVAWVDVSTSVVLLAIESRNARSELTRVIVWYLIVVQSAVPDDVVSWPTSSVATLRGSTVDRRCERKDMNLEKVPALEGSLSP